MYRPTTVDEDKAFAKVFMEFANIDTGFIVEWVEQNFRPEEVFGEAEIKKWVQENYSPEEIFGADELGKWADDNDYHQEPGDPPDPREL